MAAESYTFGRFHVSAATRELRDGAAPVELPARAFDCLVYLIAHRDRAVGRDELIAAVWGRADVSEALLNHTILKIRRALGGDGQEPIRTVPRFGYRWTGPVASASSIAPEAPAPVAAISDVSDPAATSAAARGHPNPPRRLVVGVAAATFLLGAAAFVIWHRHRAVTPAAGVAAVESEPAHPALPALVLPAVVDAPQDWAWLRFGIMDLVANRLRSGSLRTAPSESVVALLKQRPTVDGDALLKDQSLSQFAALRVLPRVRFDQGKWIVQLDAVGAQSKLAVDAESNDPIAAAREAANRLLVKLGHVIGNAGRAGTSPMQDDLLQRTGAAMLADQLDQARSLIDQAAPELRDTPPVQQRMAQIELRAGEYDAVERRLLALLDRLAPERDAALRARALITLASAYVRRNHYDKADEAYAEAIALRGDATDPEALGIAYLGRGIVLAERSRYDDAVAELGRARIELETAGDPLGVAQVDVNLGDFQSMRHRPADALPLLRSAARQFAELGAREGLVHALTGVAAAERELLDAGAALATTARFWPPDAHTSNPRMQWNATLARAFALAAAGQLREADTLIERIRSGADAKRDAALHQQAEALAGAIAMRRGNPALAAQLAGRAATTELRDSDQTLFTKTLLLEATALQAAGNLAEGAASTRRLRAWASESADDWTQLQATLAEAGQAWAETRRDAALQGFADAMQVAARLGIPDDLVAVGAAYANALIDVGHIDEARSVAGRIAPWADRDPRAAIAEVRLFRALGSADAERNARQTALRLVGEGKMPPDVGAESPPGAR